MNLLGLVGLIYSLILLPWTTYPSSIKGNEQTELGATDVINTTSIPSNKDDNSLEKSQLTTLNEKNSTESTILEAEDKVVFNNNSIIIKQAILKDNDTDSSDISPRCMKNIVFSSCQDNSIQIKVFDIREGEDFSKFCFSIAAFFKKDYPCVEAQFTTKGVTFKITQGKTINAESIIMPETTYMNNCYGLNLRSDRIQACLRWKNIKWRPNKFDGCLNIRLKYYVKPMQYIKIHCMNLRREGSEGSSASKKNTNKEEGTLVQPVDGFRVEPDILNKPPLFSGVLDLDEPQLKVNNITCLNQEKNYPAPVVYLPNRQQTNSENFLSLTPPPGKSPLLVEKDSKEPQNKNRPNILIKPNKREPSDGGLTDSEKNNPSGNSGGSVNTGKKNKNVPNNGKVGGHWPSFPSSWIPMNYAPVNIDGTKPLKVDLKMPQISSQLSQPTQSVATGNTPCNGRGSFSKYPAVPREEQSGRVEHEHDFGENPLTPGEKPLNLVENGPAGYLPSRPKKTPTTPNGDSEYGSGVKNKHTASLSSGQLQSTQNQRYPNKKPPSKSIYSQPQSTIEDKKEYPPLEISSVRPQSALNGKKPFGKPPCSLLALGQPSCNSQTGSHDERSSQSSQSQPIPDRETSVEEYPSTKIVPGQRPSNSKRGNTVKKNPPLSRIPCQSQPSTQAAVIVGRPPIRKSTICFNYPPADEVPDQLTSNTESKTFTDDYFEANNIPDPGYADLNEKRLIRNHSPPKSFPGRPLSSPEEFGDYPSRDVSIKTPAPPYGKRPNINTPPLIPGRQPTEEEIEDYIQPGVISRPPTNSKGSKQYPSSFLPYQPSTTNTIMNTGEYDQIELVPGQQSWTQGNTNKRPLESGRVPGYHNTKGEEEGDIEKYPQTVDYPDYQPPTNWKKFPGQQSSNSGSKNPYVTYPPKLNSGRRPSTSQKERPCGDCPQTWAVTRRPNKKKPQLMVIPGGRPLTSREENSNEIHHPIYIINKRKTRPPMKTQHNQKPRKWMSRSQKLEMTSGQDYDQVEEDEDDDEDLTSTTQVLSVFSTATPISGNNQNRRRQSSNCKKCKKLL